MQHFPISPAHALVANSLREGRSASPTRNMYDAPPLGDDAPLLESLLAGAMVRSQKTLQEFEKNSAYRPVKDAMVRYVSSPSLAKACVVVQESVKGATPGLCIGKIQPHTEAVCSAGGDLVFFLSHRISAPKKNLTKKLKSLFRYLALVQKKLIAAKSPFQISISPDSVSSDLWSDDILASFRVEFGIAVIEGSEDLLHESSKVAAEMIERFRQGAGRFHLRAALWRGRVSYHTNVTDTYRNSPMMGFHPLARSSDEERQIARVPIEGFLEFVNTKVDTFHKDFVDPNTCVLYLDFIVCVLGTLLDHGHYSPFTHSQVS